MSDDQNTTQNQIPEENSIPASSQEPMANAPIPPIDSESAEVPSDALESSPNDFSVKSNNIPPSDSTPTEAINEPKTEEKSVQNEPRPEPVSEPTQASESQTAQIPGNEPLNLQPEPIKSEPVSVSNYGEAKAGPENINPVPVIVPNKNKAFELLKKAKLAIQSRKRKKLDKIMTLFLKNSKITNDEVEKFLHVSDATAERYLNILEKENKIKQVGKTGHAVAYIKI